VFMRPAAAPRIGTLNRLTPSVRLCFLFVCFFVFFVFVLCLFVYFFCFFFCVLCIFLVFFRRVSTARVA